jgi:hypothetical protein
MFGAWSWQLQRCDAPEPPGRETTPAEVCKKRTSIVMKKTSALVIALLCGGRLLAAGHNSDSVVSWRNIVGVITSPGIDNPVAVTTANDGTILNQIDSGTLPWVTRIGTAQVDLVTGAVDFSVRGLVLNGGNASGTAGPINQVTGTLVCNPGSTDISQPQTILDTPPVPLSTLGTANFSGQLTAAVPYPCEGPLFLIRIGPAFGAFAGRWLATGVEPRFGPIHDVGNTHDSYRH